LTRFPFDQYRAQAGESEGVRRCCRSGQILLLYLQVDFFAVNGDSSRRRDSDANLVAADFNNGDFDIVTDLYTLVETSREN
jgi:hypothetical protein